MISLSRRDVFALALAHGQLSGQLIYCTDEKPSRVGTFAERASWAVAQADALIAALDAPTQGASAKAVA